MRDAQVKRLPVVNDTGHLVGAISIDDLVLIAQNVRVGAEAASVVGFHAVGRIERRWRGVGSLSRCRDGVHHPFLAALVARGVRRAGVLGAPHRNRRRPRRPRLEVRHRPKPAARLWIISTVITIGVVLAVFRVRAGARRDKNGLRPASPTP